MSKLIERAVGVAIGSVLYKEFRPLFRQAEDRVLIRRAVRNAEALKNEVKA